MLLKPLILKKMANVVCLQSKRNNMDILVRTQQLDKVFSYTEKVELEDSNLEIIPFQFEETSKEIENFQQRISTSEFYPVKDNEIIENKSFNYYVFTPKGKTKKEEAILLLHGLNERFWKKYLCWAEYLTQTTGKPVILFPLAFHMNRTPASWINPRVARPWINQRMQEIPHLENSTFVNLALSSRLSQQPIRFYISGMESANNILQLMTEIKNGQHPLFKENTTVHLFGYSIGAFLSEILLLANPKNCFTNSRLFMFCGGSIFSQMNANARDILDNVANDKIQHYFNTDFLTEYSTSSDDNLLEKAFKSMIRPDVLADFREGFFQETKKRIRSVSLKNDTVIPTSGIVTALGRSSDEIVEEMDFPFPYSHQWPFPLTTKGNKEVINETFREVFDKAANFL